MPGLLVRAVQKTLRKELALGSAVSGEAGDFVVASGEMHTVRDFARAAFDALGLDWRRHVKTDGRLLKKISHPLRGDFSKLRAATGWAPTIGFAEMVARLVHDAAKRLSEPIFTQPK